MKKFTKAVLCSCAIFGLFIINASNIKALESNPIDSNYVKLNQGTNQDVANNDEILEQKQNELQEFERKLRSILSSRGLITDTRSGWLDGYPNYQQEASYYCGPATIKQAVQYINGSSASQGTYASSMGTNGYDGTYVYKMASQMNYRQSAHTYAYQYIGNGASSSVWSAIVNNIWNNKPTILHASTSSLYMYNGVSLGHYITAIGYMGLDFADSNKQILYIDTWSANYGRGTTLGQHYDSMYNVASTVYNRYLIY